MSMRLEGTYVALVTPFQNGQIDKRKLIELVEFQIKSGVTGLVACGTTGETPTLSEAEQDMVIQTVVEAAQGRIHIIAGTGSNATHHVIERNKRAKELGVDAVLVVSPYYNKPTQEHLYRHFKAVSEASPLPIIIYNIQSRTAVNIETPTMARIVKDCANIIGVKESSGNLDQMTQTVLSCGPDFAVLSGDDSYMLPCVAVGGKGVISTVGNLVPKEITDLTKAALAGDMDAARKQHQHLFPLIKGVFLETNPGPIKEAMAMVGMINAEWRAPMGEMLPENRAKLREIVGKYFDLKL